MYYRILSWIVAGLGLIALGAGMARSGESPSLRTWQRWEHALTSTRNYENPYADVSSAGDLYRTGRAARSAAYGFWDGGNTFRIRCAFPVAGYVAMGNGVL